MHTQPFHGSVSFNAHHSPMGAYFSFTCGHIGTRGGMAAQLGKPANHDLYIGVKLGNRHQPAAIRCLPFFDGAQSRMQDGPTAFTLEKPGGETDSLSAYHPREIRRHYGWATDTWKAGGERSTSDDFEFSIYTSFAGIPDPANASAADMRVALLPAVTAELVIDNRKGTATKTAFFAINFNEGGARILDEGLPPGRVGFAWRSDYGVAAEATEILDDGTERPAAAAGIAPFTIMRWSVQQGLEDKSNPVHLLGTIPGIGIEVPPGKCITLRLALGCHLAGIVTTRLEGRYLYTRHFASLPEVLNHALDGFAASRTRAAELDARLENSGLNRDQQFLIAHATRSYYGNTQLLEIENEPYWIVNEGEYCMMNTLDLAVDQMFWELEQNPWVVRNVLDGFVKRYSYQDRVKIGANHEDTKNTKTHEEAAGGISFAHDQGAHNQFSPFGQSSYELKDLTGCFSYMTQEQLCNWILLAASYVAQTGDIEWARRNQSIIGSCFDSVVARRRGAGDIEGEGGFLDKDSARCGTGREITTYDSLDESLGQACNNLYIVVKTWAAYHGICVISAMAGIQDNAGHFAGNEIDHLGPKLAIRIKDHFLPAIFEPDNRGANSRILPAIEGLMYTLLWSRSGKVWPALCNPLNPRADGESAFARVLRTHTITLLSDPDRRNHFPDHGIRLSSTSDNSWLSKIALVQHVARTLFNLDENGKERPQISNPKSQISDSGPAAGWEKSDAAHVKWLTEGESAYWAASDQFINGVAKGSRYYPRLITTALWLNK